MNNYARGHFPALLVFAFHSAQRQDDDQNFELDLVLATIAADDEPHTGRAAEGEESLQPSQDPSSSHVASACGDNSDKRRQAGREAYSKGERGGQKRVTAGKESAERGSMLGARARQSGNTRKEPDLSGEGGRDSMDKFTHESIVSAATSDQQESVNSLGAGCSSFQSMNGDGGRRGESVAQRQRHSVIDDESVRGCEGERNEGRSALVSQESESASAFESSAMASMSSMPSGPPPRLNAGREKAPFDRRYIRMGVESYSFAYEYDSTPAIAGNESAMRMNTFLLNCNTCRKPLQP
jgi:hypothetical protein